ncbi:unnamed protein product, partial [Discosporangium mesarthrocarpum]
MGPEFIAEDKRSLHERYVIKDLGEVTKILGIRIVRDGEKIHLSLDQKDYAESILERFGMAECNLTHLMGKIIPPDDQKPPLDSDHRRRYQAITGAFIYLQTSTRSDLSSSVLQLSRQMKAPTKGYFGAVKRTLQYLKGTTDLAITYQRGHFILRGYVDAAYASDEKTSKSIGGYILFLGYAALTWSSHRQSMVTKCSTECELVSLIKATDKAKYLATFLPELGHDSWPVPITEDSKGTAVLAQHGAFSKRTKHITVRVHYMHDQVQAHEVQIISGPTHEQVADGFTKYLPRTAVLRFQRDI